MRMYPILGRYGPFFLYTYTVVMGLGILVALALTAWRAQRQPRPYWFDALLFAALPGLAGGRAAFVWLEWSYFQERPYEIILLWHGGLNYHGALLAGLLAFWGWFLWQQRSFGDYADLLAPGLALAHAFGWLACWFDGCAYGRETIWGLLAADLPDTFSVFALRYQTQLFGLFITILIFVLLFVAHGRGRSGQLFWLALLLLSSSRLIITFFRGDAMPLIGQIRLDTYLDSFLSLVSLLKLGQLYWFKHKATA